MSGRATDSEGLREVRIYASPTPGSATPIFTRTEVFSDFSSGTPSTEENFTLSLDLGTAPAGDYQIRAEVYDTDGNRAEDSHTIRHDPGIANLTLVTPSPGGSHAFTAGESIHIELSVEDVGCLGVEEVAIIVTGDAALLGSHPEGGDWFLSAPPYSVDTTLIPGEYGLQVAIHDSQGNPIEEIMTAPNFIVVNP